MPSSTFINLPLEKKKKFVEEALIEFSSKNYELASINVIIKKMNIARGSVYQYFEDKRDLWLSLKAHCDQIKMNHIQMVNRFDYPDFWSYYKALYAKSIEFDLEEPYCSRFLYRVGFKETCPELEAYIRQWKDDANAMFVQWVNHEKQNGSMDAGIEDEIAVHFMTSLSMSVAEFLQSKYQAEFENIVAGDRSAYGEGGRELVETVSKMVDLLKRAMQA